MRLGLMVTMGVLLSLYAYAKELKPLPDMSSAKVPTARDAETIVMRHIIASPNDGLSATETIAAKLSFALGADISGFGKKGDRIWQVHRVSFAETTSIIWVNAETGTMHVVFPKQEQNAEPPAGGYGSPAAGSPSPQP